MAKKLIKQISYPRSPANTTQAFPKYAKLNSKIGRTYYYLQRKKLRDLRTP